MFLEISGRQCGKTARLINFAIDKAYLGKSVLIVTCRQAQQVQIKKLINAAASTVKSSSGILVNNLIDVTFGNKANTRGTVYDYVCYDEFDFNPYITVNDIQPNTYFTTTPKYLRTREQRSLKTKDVLYTLVRKKRNLYCQHYASSSVYRVGDLAEQTFTEYYGEWSDERLLTRRKEHAAFTAANASLSLNSPIESTQVTLQPGDLVTDCEFSELNNTPVDPIPTHTFSVSAASVGTGRSRRLEGVAAPRLVDIEYSPAALSRMLASPGVSVRTKD